MNKFTKAFFDAFIIPPRITDAVQEKFDVTGGYVIVTTESGNGYTRVTQRFQPTIQTSPASNDINRIQENILNMQIKQENMERDLKALAAKEDYEGAVILKDKIKQLRIDITDAESVYNAMTTTKDDQSSSTYYPDLDTYR